MVREQGKGVEVKWTSHRCPAGHIDEWIGSEGGADLYSICLVHFENDYFRLYDIREGSKQIGIFNTWLKAKQASEAHKLGNL